MTNKSLIKMLQEAADQIEKNRLITDPPYPVHPVAYKWLEENEYVIK